MLANLRPEPSAPERLVGLRNLGDDLGDDLALEKPRRLALGLAAPVHFQDGTNILQDIIARVPGDIQEFAP